MTKHPVKQLESTEAEPEGSTKSRTRTKKSTVQSSPRPEDAQHEPESDVTGALPRKSNKSQFHRRPQVSVRILCSQSYGQKDHRLDLPTLSRISADAAPRAQEELLDVPTMSEESTRF